MLNIVKLHKRNLEYTLKVSNRAKRVRITVNHDGKVVVTKPKKVDPVIIEKFLISKSEWIFDKLEKFKNSPNLLNIKNTKEEYLENKDKAFILAKKRIDYFNNIYNFKFNKITIKNQKTRWGSCSRKGNLNFNYKIALLPKHISDYIIVHELCHLKELNHSRKFWKLVGVAVPSYLDIKKELKGGLV